MYVQKYDVLIIGSGVAGMSAAVKLAEKNLSIALVSKDSTLKSSNSYWAQGGIIYFKTDKNDSFDLFEADIQKASVGTSSEKAIETLCEGSKKIFKDLLIQKAKVPFCTDEKKHLKLTREAAHSVNRIAYHDDCSGKAISTSLLKYVKSFKNITILNHHVGIDLITPSHHGIELKQRYEEDQVVGAYVFDSKEDKVIKIISKRTIIATGGIGAIYLHHTNAEGARGDGIAMASRAGAKINNMEFVQFHPTSFYDQNSHRRFLISEAVRGEGAILKNSKGYAFMQKYHPDKELAPRDVVARSIILEMFETGDNNVFLDISHKEDSWIITRFPTIYNFCLQHGIDIRKNGIPVVPAAHYLCGGIKVNFDGQTNLKNLYAVGESACTGLHGANRLASTSLIEGIVWGHNAALNILKNIEMDKFYQIDKISNWERAQNNSDPSLIAQDWLTVRQTMWNYVGLFRSTDRLKRAQAMLNELSYEIHRFYRNTKLNDELIGLRNAVEVSQMILRSSLLNKKSEGCFYKN